MYRHLAGVGISRNDMLPLLCTLLIVLFLDFAGSRRPVRRWICGSPHLKLVRMRIGLIKEIKSFYISEGCADRNISD